MSMGERKAALFLASLPIREQRRFFALLPQAASRRLHALIDELLAMNVCLDGVAQELLAEEVCGLTEATSLGIDEILTLSKRLPRAWFARMLTVWGGLDRNFVLALLEDAVAAEVRAELERIGKLPAKMADALRSEAMVLAGKGG